MCLLCHRSTRCHTELEAAPCLCLFPSCRRRWRSCISTKTRAESQTDPNITFKSPPPFRLQPPTNNGQNIQMSPCFWPRSVRLVLNWWSLLDVLFLNASKDLTDSFVFQVWSCHVSWFYFFVSLISRTCYLGFKQRISYHNLWTPHLSLEQVPLVLWC